jgi:hypothetical protein
LGKQEIVLFLERTKISHVWLDNINIGKDSSLCTPHIYDISHAASSGKHMITLLIDNDNLPSIGQPHQLSEDTQTNWNGIIGRIELQVFDKVWIDHVSTFPNIQKKQILLNIEIINGTENMVNCELTISASTFNSSLNYKCKELSYKTNQSPGKSKLSIIYEVEDYLLLWDEFSPCMYKLQVQLQASNKYCDCVEAEIGMRKFSTKNTQFTINDRIIFLRGTHDACVFPLTGYPPMEIDTWVKIFEIAKSYGLNHYRFHTWCPPEAAFKAADLVGIYLQPELPNWMSFYEPSNEKFNAYHEPYLREEGYRILRAYGNHPSFTMFALGNELFGSRKIMACIIKDFRKMDDRHLYAQGSNNFFSQPALAEGDDFWITFRTKGADFPVRGAFSNADYPLGHIQNNPPSTLCDYSKSIADVPLPVIGHEVGNYQVYPDFTEISKYTGVLQPRNLETFRDRLFVSGMLDQADDFFKASGHLAVICYREEIEAAIRTKGFGGFQLLDIKDYPGQGTALVGILDSFMDSKSLINPAKWKEFCSEIVLLARFSQYTYFSSEKVSITIQAANYGPADIIDSAVEWELTNETNTVLASGQLRSANIIQGKVSTVGDIIVYLDNLTKAEKLTLKVYIVGTNIKNHYPIWVYPKEETNLTSDEIKICCDFDDKTEQFLYEGKKVLFLPADDRKLACVDGAFITDFWNYPMYRRICERKGIKANPGTLGILCNPKHPALSSFPTEFHSNWQWWHIVKNSHPIILSNMLSGLDVIVQIVDNFERNYKLGLIFEVCVGKGKLLVCACNLLAYRDKPEVMQLLNSLHFYMKTTSFSPKAKMDFKSMMKILSFE